MKKFWWLLLLTAFVIALMAVFPTKTDRGTIAFSAPAEDDTEDGLIELGVGECLAIAVPDAVSDADDVAEVSPGGVIWGIGEGECSVCYMLDGEERELTVRVLPAPQTMRITGPETALGVGEKYALTARAYRMDGHSTSARFMFTTSNPKVAQVTADGDVTAVGIGSAVITAGTYNGLNASIRIDVGRRPSSVSVRSVDIMLGAGEIMPLDPVVKGGSAADIEIESSDSGVAMIMGHSVLGVAPGEAVVTARLYNGKTAACRVTVRRAPKGIGFAKTPPDAGVGQTIVPEIELVGYMVQSGVSYTSSDPDIVNVENGAPIAVNEGECVLTARTFNGHEASVPVRVRPAPTELSMEVKEISLGVGEAYSPACTMDAGAAAAFRWMTSDGRVVSVSREGDVTAIGKGKAVITAVTHNGLKARLKVTVKDMPKTLKIDRTDMEICVDESVYVTSRLNSGAAADISYSSSDLSVIRVDKNGRVTAVSPGEATVIAETYNGLRAECRIRTYLPAATIDRPEKIELIAGESADVPIMVRDKFGGPYAGMTYFLSADPDIVYEEDGQLLPIGHGTTYMTVTAGDISERVLVEVAPWKDSRNALVAAHRGGSGYGTENTLKALRGAARDGADFVEIDVRRTRDGELVLMHDATILRTSGKGGRVARLTYAYLKSVDFHGAEICTLDEALDFIAGTDMNVFIEMKCKDIEEECVRAAQRAGLMERSVFISFKISELDRIRQFDPDAQVGYLWSSRLRDPAEFARAHEIDWMLPKYTIVSEDVVSSIHLVGANVGSWTTNTILEARAVINSGVDLIITDRVEMAQNASK